MKAFRWLDRRIAAPGPYLTLCLFEHEFREALRHLKVAEDIPWIKTPHSQATAHHLRSERGGLTCIVCINDWQGRDPIEVAGLLVHEAVHAWQEYADSIGEHNPGKEQEAYAVQSIAQELMAEFARRIKAVGR
jgi:hypothetical protein